MIGLDSKGNSIDFVVCNFLNGDDLSENLYRLCVGQHLRYGHNQPPKNNPTEKLSIIKRVVNSCKEVASLGNYKIANAAISLGDIKI